MEKINWKLLGPDDIEVRQAMNKDGKATLLLYQNSRTAMEALDETFGSFGWKLEYKDVGGQIYGRLSIKEPETGEWIYREDTGEESNISAEKGMSSDILKRLTVRFGYARELYSAPRIVVDCDNKFSQFYVREIGYDTKRKINQLTIVDKKGNVVFQYGTKIQHTDEPKQDRKQELIDFCTARQEEGDNREVLKKFYKFYVDKADTFNVFNVSKLYNKWVENER